MILRCAVIAALLGLTGCAGYASLSPKLGDALVHDDYAGALEVVEKINRSNSELLYCYEKSQVLRAQGDYAGSNQTLERAEALLEELYTKSVTRELAALTVSETIAQYRGDAFEAVRVNYYKLLNYLALGDVEGAVVESRRLSHKLQLLHDGGETYFVDDPFLQYLTALVYEMGGENESAGVAYRVAKAGYDRPAGWTGETPPWLYCDASANARRRGDAAAVAEYDSLATCDGNSGATGRLTVVIESGRVVRKLESNLVLPIFEKDHWDNNEAFARELAGRYGATYGPHVKVKYWLRISLPVLERRPPGVAYAVVRATRTDGGPQGVVETRTARVEDVDALAVQAFREKQATVFLRAIIRGLGKYVAAEAAGNEDEVAGALVNLFGAATETADTRSWTTLPEVTLLARLNLPEGKYRIEADVVDQQGQALRRVTFGEVDVRAGSSRIQTARAY